jgi:hypothetical protein
MLFSRQTSPPWVGQATALSLGLLTLGCERVGGARLVLVDSETVVVKFLGMLIDGGVVVLSLGAVVFRVSVIGMLVVGVTIAVVVVLSIAGVAVAAMEFPSVMGVMAVRPVVELATPDEPIVAVLLPPPAAVV